MNQEKAPTSEFYKALIFACAGHFLVDFMIGIWPIYKTMAYLDLAVAGIIAATCVIIGEAMQILFGTLADRGYQKQLLILGPLLAAASAFFSYVESYPFFLLLYLMTCIGSAAFHPTAASLLGGLSSKYKNIVMCFFATSGMVGLACSQILFSWTHRTLDGHTGILVIPAIFLAVAIIALRPSQPLISKEEHVSFKTIFSFFKNSSLRSLYFVLVANQITLWSTLFLLPDFLRSRLYPEWVVFGGGNMAFMLGAAIVAPLLGYVADRLSSKLIICWTFCLTIPCYYLLLSSYILPPEFLLPLLFVLGASLGTVSPIAIALGNHLVTDNRGMVSAFLMGGVWVVSESTGVGLSGILANLFGEDAPAKALSCMGIVLFFGTVFAFSLPSKAQVSLQEEVNDDLNASSS